MRFECRQKVGEILDRNVSEAEGKEILNQVRFAFKSLRDSMPDTFDSIPHDDQVFMAAKLIANNIEANAKQQAKNMRMQALKQHQLFLEKKRLAQEEDMHAYKGIAQIFRGVENYIRGIQNSYLHNLADMFNAIDSKFFGLREDPASVREFVGASFGEKVSNKIRKGYEAYQKTLKAMLARARAAGLIGGELEDYIPQSHDQWKVAKAGKTLGKKGVSDEDAWVDFVAPLLDRNKFLRDDGTPMSDAEYRDVLKTAYNNIVTKGNPDDPFEVIKTQREMRANKGGKYKLQHRILHFKDADSWMAYHQAFGRGSLSQMMTGSIMNLAHTIGMLERFGPNPEASYEYLKQLAEYEKNSKGPAAREDSRFSERQGFTKVKIDAVWKNLTGEANHADSLRGAAVMQHIRNLEVAGMLGKALISSISDIPTYFIASHFNNIPFTDALKMLPQAFGKDWKNYAMQMGIVADSVISDFSRWSGENLGQNWSGKLANGVMRASFLSGWTDIVRRAFSINMMAGLGRLVKTDWANLNGYDRARLTEAGINEADWNVIRSAGVDTHNGVDFLNMQALKEIDMQTAAKVLGFVVQESEMASLNPDIVSRAEANRGEQRGTWGGEFYRCFFLFKSFPLAMMEKQWRRAKWLERHGKVNRLAYMAGISIATTAAGVVSVQLQQLLNGKDMRDMSSKQFWLDAFMKGGGAGFIGDLAANMFSEDSRKGTFQLADFAGPTISSGVDALNIMSMLVSEGLYDKDTKAAAKTANLIRRHTPFVNLWYTSAAIDRAVWNEMQEWLSPGYMRQMQRRQQRMYGQGYWWSPEDISDIRAPEFAEVPDR